jgi:hypothetical protein
MWHFFSAHSDKCVSVLSWSLTRSADVTLSSQLPCHSLRDCTQKFIMKDKSRAVTRKCYLSLKGKTVQPRASNSSCCLWRSCSFFVTSSVPGKPGRKEAEFSTVVAVTSTLLIRQ